MKKYFNQQGLTLIELMIAVSLFTVVMMISTTMFLKSIDGQSRSVASKNLQESLNYALAVMSNEATNAIQNPSSCVISLADCQTATDFFCSVGGNTNLHFRNSNTDCVAYEIENDVNGVPRLKITRGVNFAYITPENIRVTSLVFNVGNTTDTTYPIGEATIAITGQSISKGSPSESLVLQTTVATWPNQ